MFTWSHARTAAAAFGPGATGDAKRLPAACATRCVERSEERRPSARSRPSGTAVVLWTHSATRTRPPSTGVAAMRTRPSTASKANGTVRPSSRISSSSAIGPSSMRRATPWWRSPLGSRNATAPATGAPGADGSSTTCMRARSNVCGPPAAYTGG